MNQNPWKKLNEDSSQLTKPTPVKALLSQEQLAGFKLHLLSILRNFLEQGDVHIGLKTYINNELNHDRIDKMLCNPPSEDHSLETWSKQIFEEEKFGMVLNYLEKYSNEFTEQAATLVAPLLEEAGLPLDGLSFLFFMGNYGFTPFGVHKEAIGEEGILFHLGPGTKQFYTWDDPKYNAIAHNTQVFHDVQQMLPDARCYELQPGDAMFIPNQVYHIANTAEFSVSFVMDYVNPPMDRFENQLLKLAQEENLNGQRTYQVPLNSESPRSKWNQLLNVESIQNKMAIALQRKIWSLKSNGGILIKSIVKRGVHLPNGVFSIKGKAVFPLFTDRQNNDQILIFARGHRITKKHHPRLAELIQQLNDGASISFKIIQDVLAPEWDLIEIYSFISELAQIEAITIED